MELDPARVLVALLALAAAGAIFATTRPGRRLLRRLGLPEPGARGTSPSREQRRMLLRACQGDRAVMERLLDAERKKFPAMSEAEITRRVLRALWRDRR